MDYDEILKTQKSYLKKYLSRGNDENWISACWKGISNAIAKNIVGSKN